MMDRIYPGLAKPLNPKSTVFFLPSAEILFKAILSIDALDPTEWSGVTSIP